MFLAYVREHQTHFQQVIVERILERSAMDVIIADLLTEKEKNDLSCQVESSTLVERLAHFTQDLMRDHPFAALSYFGIGAGGVAALSAAAELDNHIRSTVCCGGSPHLTRAFLSRVTVPTLLVVGSEGAGSFLQIPPAVTFEVVPGASFSLDEPRALEAAVHLATDWLLQWTLHGSSAALHQVVSRRGFDGAHFGGA